MVIAAIIVEHTPAYVWALLALLLFLGVRRLKPRQTHLALAALAPMGFFTWSVVAACLLFFSGEERTAAIGWAVAFLAGALSGPIRTVPRPKLCMAGRSNMLLRRCRSHSTCSFGRRGMGLEYGPDLRLRWQTSGDAAPYGYGAAREA